MINFYYFLCVFGQNQIYSLAFLLLSYCVFFVSQTSMSTEETNANNKNSSTAKHPRIMGGIKVPLGLASFQVSIQEAIKLGENQCGGAIISQSWVLTAAHCIEAPTYIIKNYILAVGIVNLKATNIPYYKIKKCEPHPKYDTSSYDNDIGMLQIDGKFQFNKHINKIRYSLVPAEVGTTCLVTGWGAIDSEQTEYPNDLYMTSMTVLDKAICQDKVSVFNSEGQICSGTEKGVDFCDADSGSPFICLNNGLTGLVSYGTAKCGIGEPSVFTDVYYYRSWIKETMEEFSSHRSCSTNLRMFIFLLLLIIIFSICSL